VAQHFLMSAAARTLSLVDLCELSEDAAHKMLCEMRWEDLTAPGLPPLQLPRRLYLSVSSRVQMQACHRQFSVTSGTLLAYWKLPFRTLLMALRELSRLWGVRLPSAFSEGNPTGGSNRWPNPEPSVPL